MSDGRSGEQGSLRRLNLRLPPLPQTVPQALELLHAPGFVAPEDLAAVLQGDPAAVTRILKHINSAYYGLRRSITDVERAIRMMGPTTATGTVTSLCMLEMDELMEGPAEGCFRRLLRHSEATAFLTHELLDGDLSEEDGTQDGREAPEEETHLKGVGFTEGLLHDFGKMVLVYNYPEKAVAFYEDKVFEGYLSETNHRALEQLVFGCDHTEAGRYAASEMNFPQALIDVIRYHHDPDEAEGKTEAMETVQAVGAANLATKAMGAPFTGVYPTESSLSWEACAEHPVWEELSEDAENEEEADPARRLEELNERRKDVALFSESFLDADTPDPA